MTAEQYAEAMSKLRAHFLECNCFLPYVSCTLEIDSLRQEAGEYNADRREDAR